MLSYTEAFDAMIEMFRTRYAFTEYKHLDWDAISDEFRPRFERGRGRTMTPRRTASRCATSRGRSPTAMSAGRSRQPRSACSPKRPTVASGMAIRELDDGRTDHQLRARRRPADRGRHRAARRDPRDRRPAGRRRGRARRCRGRHRSAPSTSAGCSSCATRPASRSTPPSTSRSRIPATPNLRRSR